MLPHGSSAVEAVAAVKGVVLDDRRWRPDFHVPVAFIVAVIVIEEVVEDGVAASGRHDSPGRRWNRPRCARATAAATEINAVAVVQVNPVADGLDTPAPSRRSAGSPEFSWIRLLQARDAVVAIQSDAVVVVTVVAVGHELAVEVDAPVRVVMDAVAGDGAAASVGIEAVPVVARDAAG